MFLPQVCAQSITQICYLRAAAALSPLPAPVRRRRIAIANIDPDIDGGDSDHSDRPEIPIHDVNDWLAIELLAADPIADIDIDQSDPDIDGDDEGGGVGQYAEFILGAKV